MAARQTISDQQFLHMKMSLSAYQSASGLPFAEMSRLCNVGHGTIATLVRENYMIRPTVLLARRIMQGLSMTEIELLGAADADPVADPTLWDAPGDPTGVLSDTNEDMLETLSALRSLVETVQALHHTQTECYGTLRDIHAVLMSMWDRQLRT